MSGRAAKTPFNPAHLDHLSRDITLFGVVHRIVYIYCEAPEYECIGDPFEGIACVDDAARAAVVLLRHFELTGDNASLFKARRLMRFILYMQNDKGLFHNFVLNEQLEINTHHFRSSTDGIHFWTCRAAWALGTAVAVLKDADPGLASACHVSLQRVFPHIERLLLRYPQTNDYRGRMTPTWLVQGDGADATSELMLGLTALHRAEPSVEVQSMVQRFAEGLAMMRYGSIGVFPYGCHASNKEGWHKWGNSQTQALADAGLADSARLEAEMFYPRLLIEGYVHSIAFDDLHAIQYFERIAYGIRSVAVGLLRLYEATHDDRYAIMAGLAATWFNGNNAVGELMYDPATGRCFDGISDARQINRNAGAESTIEALYTVLELNQIDASRLWMHAHSGEPTKVHLDGEDWFFRVFEVTDDDGTHRVAPAMNLTRETFELAEADLLNRLLSC